MKKYFFLLLALSFVTLTGCKSEKDIKEDKIIESYSRIMAAIVFNNFSSYEISDLQQNISGIPEFQPLDSILTLMLDSHSFNVFQVEEECPVDIKVYASGPSSVNGWNVSVKVTNSSDKILKYIYFNVIGHNSVGDIIH